MIKVDLGPDQFMAARAGLNRLGKCAERDSLSFDLLTNAVMLAIQ